MFNPNPAFLLVQKLKSAPKGFTLGVKAEIEKKISICPKLLVNAELSGLCIGPEAEKMDTTKFGRPICNSWGPMFQHLLIW
jgi:hypothetical protein